MEMVRELGSKGQVVIPNDVRKMLGLQEGTRIVFTVDNEEIKIKKEQNVDDFLKEFFDTPKLKKSLTARELKEMYEESYDLPRYEYFSASSSL